jgi:hypothetical protein
MRQRTTYNVSYRVLDASGRCLEVFSQSGRNKNYVQWLVERKMKKRYGKNIKLQRIKVEEEA